MALTALQLIEHFSMTPHPEGGYFRETYKSTEEIHEECLPLRFTGERVFSTGIYFLLRGFEFSAFHRIKSDEMWHFYDGSPLNIYIIDPNGSFELVTLGRNFHFGETYQAVVKAGSWFASQCTQEEGFSFVGCTVAPGFDFADFELADRETLIGEFPMHEALIRKLTR